MGNKKEYVIWYKAGAGGFFVSWLVQISMDPAMLNLALESFPVSLTAHPNNWKKYEKVPPAVGVLCNVFHPDPCFKIDFDSCMKKTLNTVTSQGESFYDLLHCRIKFYLVNHVWRSGNVTQQFFDYIRDNPEEFKLHDTEYIKNMTDIIFDVKKNIFVTAPEDYLKIVARVKKLRHVNSDINEVLRQYTSLKTFSIDSIWKGRWIDELEKILEIKLSNQQVEACQIFVNHYFEIMPDEVKRYCNAN